MECVIFDMDGVLIDSEPLHYRVDKMLTESLNIDLSKEYLDSFIGYSDIAMWQKLKNDFQLEINISVLLESQLVLKLQLLQEWACEPIDGILELLTELKYNNIPMCIASSSPRSFINAVLKKLKISKFFHYIVSGDDVKHSKPDPAIFLMVCQLLQIEPATS